MAESRNVIVGCMFALCTLSGFAQTTLSENRGPEPPRGASLTSTDPSQLAQRLMDDRVAIWRQRLKLEDWKISVVMARRSSLEPNTTGGIRWDKSKKSAVISLLDPADYGLPLPQMLDEMELTVVHELVHLDLASLPRGQANSGSEEQVVTGIAQAMLGLDRKKD
jgi:hypothetical protein